MLKFVILLSAVACALGAAIPESMLPQSDGRIVGGVATTISSFPYQVSVERFNQHNCGGSIMSSTFITTAAHCMQVPGASIYTVRAGSTFANRGGTVVGVADFKNHEGYNDDTMVNDIAVIRLRSPLVFSSTIQPIALASTTPVNGASAVVSGWGAETSGAQASPETLRMTGLTIVSNKACGNRTFGYGDEIQAGMICAVGPGKDSCQGDSGGPLASGGKLVGVVSWGNGCADPNFPGVYTNVADFRTWLSTNAGFI